MTTTELNLIAPLEMSLPPPPKGEVLTDSQWTTLLAIADAIIPCLQSPSQASHGDVVLDAATYSTTLDRLKRQVKHGDANQVAGGFLSEYPSAVPEFRDVMHRLLGESLREESLKGIKVILSALNTRIGCLTATGSTVPFHEQSVATRDEIIQGWTQSYIPTLRTTARAFTSLAVSQWARISPTFGQVLGFPRAPVHGRPGKGFDFQFVQLPPGSEPETIDTDVIIVGSGCGAGVCAKNLAEAGHKVIVTEKSYHWGPEYLPMSEKDAGPHLFANGAAESSDDGSIACISGSVWGGGGTINWSASLQTQGFVRNEWADEGLRFFTSSAYQECLDRVCDRMGVSTRYVEHNINNQTLVEGARKLGYRHKDVPQNTGGKKHYCGYCTLGCGAAEKQGPVVSFLPDAAKAGAQFIEGFNVEKVLFDDSDGKGRATGVQGTWTSRDSHGGVSGSDRYARRLIIKAKRVIISAGTLNSPLVLLRSGLKNPQIGRNLHLHPAVSVTAIHSNRTTPINPWEGGILTTVVDEFENLDSHGHGAKLETTVMLPSLLLPLQPWRGGFAFKDVASKISYMTSPIIIVRDRDTGRVYPDPVDGKTRVQYTPSSFDTKHGLEGVLAAAKIMYVAGATEIYLPNANIPPFIRRDSSATTSVDGGHSDDSNPSRKIDTGINDPDFITWLSTVRHIGLPPRDTRWASAHQMGTCRMSTSPRTGVVDPHGKVWDTEGLYVADASVFPSASGVNPMVTTMAISDWISRGVAEGLGEKQ